MHGRIVAATQPEKLAAMEAQWETMKGAPFAMLLIPSEAQERNIVDAIQIPKFLSYLAKNDWNAEIRGLKSWPKEDRPPVTLVFLAFRLMVGLGFLFVLIAFVGIDRKSVV